MGETHTNSVWRMSLTFGQRVRAVIQEKEISIEETAYRARMARSQLNKILSGNTRSPGIENVAKIARALECTVDELLEGVEFD